MSAVYGAEGMPANRCDTDPEMAATPIGHRLAAREPVTIGDLDAELMAPIDTVPAHHVGRPSQIPGVRTLEEKLDASRAATASPSSRPQRPRITSETTSPTALWPTHRRTRVALAAAGQSDQPVDSLISTAILVHRGS